MKKIRVLIIADLESWILGKIARELSKILPRNGEIEVNILMSGDPEFLNIFFKLQSEYDVIHFLSTYDFFHYVNLTYRPCITMFWHLIESDWYLMDKYLRRLDALSVGSQQWLNYCQARISTDLFITRIGYGLDLKTFQKRPNAKIEFIKKNHLPENTLILGFAGKASSNEGNRKGLDRLFNCLNLLSSGNDINIILRIIGRQWTLDFIPKNLQHLVKLELDIPEEKLPEFYSSLDYYICTSRYEGVPYPVLESMGCQCVVISTSVGIVPEIIDHGYNGFILTENNLENDFLNILKQTANNLEDRIKCGYEARKTVEKLFSWHSSVNLEEYKLLYQKGIEKYFSRNFFEKLTFWVNAQKLFYLIYCKNIYHNLKQKIKEKLIKNA